MKEDRPRCDRWARRGECDTNPDFMMAYCRRSCMGEGYVKSKPIAVASGRNWGGGGGGEGFILVWFVHFGCSEQLNKTHYFRKTIFVKSLLYHSTVSYHNNGTLTMFCCLCVCRLVGRSIGTSVGRSIGTSVGRSVDRYFSPSVGRSVRQSVGRSIGTSVRRSVGRSVLQSVGRSLGTSVRRSVDRYVSPSVGRSVRQSVGRSLGTSVRRSVDRYFSPSLVHLSVGRSVAGRKWKPNRRAVRSAEVALFMVANFTGSFLCCRQEASEQIRVLSGMGAKRLLHHKPDPDAASLPVQLRLEEKLTGCQLKNGSCHKGKLLQAEPWLVFFFGQARTRVYLMSKR